MIAALALDGSEAVFGRSSNNRLTDAGSGADWAGHRRTFGQQHFPPLASIVQHNVDSLGLVWALDLPGESTATQPIGFDGILYVATRLSVVRANHRLSGDQTFCATASAA